MIKTTKLKDILSYLRAHMEKTKEYFGSPIIFLAIKQITRSVLHLHVIINWCRLDTEQKVWGGGWKHMLIDIIFLRTNDERRERRK